MPPTNPRYSAISAIGAFVLWGSWSFWINRHAGLHQGLVSGLTQGTASLLITLVMVRLVGFFFGVFPYPLRVWLPPLLTVAITGSALAGVHWLAHTPHILSTIALPLAVALGFCWFTAYRCEQEAAIRRS